MADVVDVRTGPREVTEFLTLEGSSPIRIHTCLRCVYGEDAIDVRSVRLWVRRFKNSKRDADDRSRNSRPDTIATETTGNVDAPIQEYCRITTCELCAALGKRKPAVIAVTI